MTLVTLVIACGAEDGGEGAPSSGRAGRAGFGTARFEDPALSAALAGLYRVYDQEHGGHMIELTPDGRFALTVSGTCFDDGRWSGSWHLEDIGGPVVVLHADTLEWAGPYEVFGSADRWWEYEALVVDDRLCLAVLQTVDELFDAGELRAASLVSREVPAELPDVVRRQVR